MRTMMFLVVLLIVVHPSSADVYKCPDGKGGVRYQHMPCVGETAPLFESAPAAEPSRQPAPTPAGESSSTSSSVSPPPPPPREPPPQATIKTPAQPVDTLQFGLIQNGMSEGTIVQRLGEPGKVLKMPTVFRRNGSVLIRRYAWVYPGTPQIMRTLIYFENGEVVGKEKTPESGVR